MAKITPKKDNNTVVVRTNSNYNKPRQYAWWKAQTQEEMNNQLMATAAFLKQAQEYRYRQAILLSTLYSNYPVFGQSGVNMNKMAMPAQLPIDRPTLNVIQSCIDTLVSRLTQNRPRPMFLTDDGDYKERKLAKQLNTFIQGEFYQCKAYEHGENNLKDRLILGDGITKVFKHEDKVKLERRLPVDILIDEEEAREGNPRQLLELRLIDRECLIEMCPKHKSDIEKAEQGFTNDADNERSLSDRVLVVEGWHLPSGKDATDGKHILGCSSGLLHKEEFTKQKFPFVIDGYSKRMLGFWSQGLAEQIMGTQVEINKLLRTISASINLMGVPRVWLEDGSKVVKAHINNNVGMIGTYRGTLPTFMEGTSGIAADIYAQLQRLVDYAYQQAGLSQMAAASQKPAGLNSGEAIRSFDDIQSDRFASTQKKQSSYYEELASLMFETACEIKEETGKYSTISPSKNGAKEIDLPDIKELKEKQFIIQCFDVSSLPKEPAGRLQKITEMIEAGMIDIREGRRLLDFPDLDQAEKLANAGEERILQILDQIVEEGKYTPPDPFMDLQLALTLSVQYYNLYVAAKLEEEKAIMLRTFNTQIKALIMESNQPPPMGAQPMANPEPLPTSPLVPQVPGAA